MKSQLDAFLIVREHSAKVQVDTDKSTHQNSRSVTLELYHISELEIEKVIIEDLLKPLLFVIKYTLPFHNTIKYDPVEGCCVHVKGSFWRHMWCVVWELLIIFRFGILVIPSINADFLSTTPPAEDKGGISLVAQGANLMFILFGLVNFDIFCFRTKSMCDVINYALHLAKRIHLDEASPSRSNFMKYVTHASWMYVICYVILTFVMHTFQAFSSSTRNPAQSEDLSDNTGPHRLDITGLPITFESAYLNWLAVVANLVCIAWWMMVNFLFSTWALFFRQLLKLFYWRIQTKHQLGHYIIIPHEIRTFNKISSVVDKFNQIYGILALFASVVIVTYIALSVKHIFVGVDHLLDMSSGLHLWLSHVPLGLGSVMLAEVPRVAGMFAAIIKEEFGKFTKASGDPAESLCGIAIVHYDLTTSNIGVKGLGFFAVSYQFIATTVGVIISYSIVMAQLFPKEKVTMHNGNHTTY